MKKDLVLNIFILLLVILIDQVTKSIAIYNNTFVANAGMMFGSFSGSHAVIRVSLISSGSIFCLLAYIYFIYGLSSKLKLLKLGLGLFFGGVLSNAIDKMYLNFVVDFIPIKIGKYHFYANVADAIQLVGIIFILYVLFFCQDRVWHPDEKRSQVFVNKNAQIAFGLKFAVAGLLSLLMISIFSYTYMSVEFSTFGEASKKEFILMALVLSFLFSVFLFILGVYLSHLFYGPIFKLKKYIENEDWEAEFKLRENDQFKELEDMVKNLKNRAPKT